MPGKPSDAATIEARRHRLTELLADGRSVSQCFEDLVQDGFPASRTTLWRDVVELRKEWKTSNVKNFDALREKQLGILQKIEQALLEDLVEPEKARVWLACRKDISSLLGLDAPNRSVSVNLDMKQIEDMTTGELTEQMMKGLTDENRQRVWDFMGQLAAEQAGDPLALPEPEPQYVSAIDWTAARAAGPPAQETSKALEGQVLDRDGRARRLGR